MECACVMGIKVGRKMGGQMNNDKAFNVWAWFRCKTTPPAEWRTGLLNYKLPITRLYSCSDLLLIFLKLVRCTRRWLSVI